jgi:hypothetical protein
MKKNDAGSENINGECQDVRETADRIESARLNRRQALRRLGFTAGAAFGMMAIGDIARFVQQQMEMTDRSKTVADRLVDQFAKSNVASAMKTPQEICIDEANSVFQICLNTHPGGETACSAQHDAAIQACDNHS